MIRRLLYYLIVSDYALRRRKGEQYLAAGRDHSMDEVRRTIACKAGKKCRKMDELFAVEIAKGPLHNKRQLEKSGEVSYKEIGDLIGLDNETVESYVRTRDICSTD